MPSVAPWGPLSTSVTSRSSVGRPGKGRVEGEREMEPDSGFVSILSTLNTGIDVLVAIGVIVLGFVVVRPVHQTAGMVIGGAGGARLVGLILLSVLHALQTPGDFSIALGLFGSLISLGMSAVFWGGIIMGVWQMAEYQMKRGGIR